MAEKKFRIFNEIISLIKDRFHEKAFIYYNEFENDYSVCISNFDLYFSESFREFNRETSSKYQDLEITIIYLPEDFSKNFNTNFSYNELHNDSINVNISFNIFPTENDLSPSIFLPKLNFNENSSIDIFKGIVLNKISRITNTYQVEKREDELIPIEENEDQSIAA